MAHTCNLSIWETEAGGLHWATEFVQGQFGTRSEILSQQ